MFLRKTAERFLPVREDEQRLSPMAAHMVFRGRYANRDFQYVEPRRNPSQHSGEVYPYTYEVVRADSRGIKSFSNHPFTSFFMGEVSPVPLTAQIEELTGPASIARVRRVERVASRIKMAAAAVAGLAVAVTLAAFLSSPDERPATGPSLPACEDVTDGSETLLPVKPSRPASLSQFEQCQLGGHPYSIVESAN